MSTGIGIDCKRCGHQLNYDDGFDDSTKLCNECYNITKFEGNLSKGLPGYTIEELIDELHNRCLYVDEDDLIRLKDLFRNWFEYINK